MHKCDLCDKAAVLHDLVLEGSQWKPVHLCEEHARAQGYPGSGDVSGSPAPAPAEKPRSAKRRRVASCETCGLTLAAFRRKGLLGCHDCYRAFEAHLEPLIGRAQAGATYHTGHVPPQKEDHVDRRLSRIRLLKELNEAVSSEQYERAARIRDDLQSLEGSLEIEKD